MFIYRDLKGSTKMAVIYDDCVAKVLTTKMVIYDDCVAKMFTYRGFKDALCLSGGNSHIRRRLPALEKTMSNAREAAHVQSQNCQIQRFDDARYWF